MQIRPGTLQDIESVVSVHMAAFPSAFLTTLGRPFLRLLYEQCLVHQLGVLIVCEENHAVRGFAAGTQRQTGFYRDLVREHCWRFAVASVRAVAARPWILPRLLRAFRRSSQSRQSAAEACLMSIGVDPAISGKGVGRELANSFCGELEKMGCRSVCLTTDKVNNDRVNRFYRSLGFAVAREFTTPEGREMYEYVKQLGH